MNINQNNPLQSNQESSSFFTYAPLDSLKTNEIPDQHHRNSYRGLQQEQTQVQSNQDLDPVAGGSLTQAPAFRQPEPLVRYRECLKNHGANMGSHVLDGCGEFLANGEEHTPEGLKCAACECHRSFHRREEEGESQSAIRTNNAIVVHATLPRASVMQAHHHHNMYNMPPTMVAFGGGTSVAPTESSSDELDMFRTHPGQPLSKKRFRTKITEEQKEKMHQFAEKIGWRIQKQCEQEMQQFCNEIGLKRKVFKVWMHNSKQASKKKQE